MVTANANDIFAEAVSVVPLVHAPVRNEQNALIIGSHALPAAGLALRYPSFNDIVVLDASIDKFNGDRRIRKVSNAKDIPAKWTADLIVIAEPIITPDHVKLAKAVSNTESVVVFAVNDISRAASLRRDLAEQWKYVAPYREHLPRPVIFLMASSRPLNLQRRVPAGTIRIHKNYIPSLFTLAKDEYVTVYGER